jgi:gas vesicle protein
MSQQDNFVGGFLTGAVVGGIVGGIVGVLVTSRLSNSERSPEESFPKLDEKANKGKKRQIKASTEQSIELARRGLEDKIAQLNEAIDDVRQQLGNVNGSKTADEERAIARDS